MVMYAKLAFHNVQRFIKNPLTHNCRFQRNIEKT